MKTYELTGAALDWAVAKCEGINYEVIDGGLDYDCPDYSTHWAQGGPIIAREKLLLLPDKGGWVAYAKGKALDIGFPMRDPTPLIAAMRCYVASRLGDEVDVPEELIIPTHPTQNS